MKHIAPFICVALLMPAPGSAADTDTIDSTVKTVYAVISGPAGPRDWTRFRALFAEGARLIPVRAKGAESSATVLTPDGYVERTTPTFDKNAFYESEVSRRVEEFGNIAHVFSTYESRRAPGEKPFARGINSIQLVRINGAWKVMTILWDSEREGNPLPERYQK